MKNRKNQLFFVTLIFFGLGFLHISFAILGLACFITPFILYWKHGDKVWCKYYCPRAGFLTKVLGKISLGKKPPAFLSGPKLKKGIIIYFTINLFFVTMSTIMVSLGRIEPIEQIRFLIMFPLPFTMPQVLNLSVPANIIHLGYRVYSMMFTSTIVGLLVGFLYRPRTWCGFCPVQTLTTKSRKVFLRLVCVFCHYFLNSY